MVLYRFRYDGGDRFFLYGLCPRSLRNYPRKEKYSPRLPAERTSAFI